MVFPMLAIVTPVLGWSLAAVAVAVLLLVFVSMRGKTTTQAPAAATSRLKEHWLLDPEAEGGAMSWHIGQRTVSVGRGAANFVQVNTPGVSRMHCQLRPKPEGLQLVDMTSSNGTIVNGEATSDYILRDHDILSVGDRNFIYRAKGEFGENAGFKAKDADQSTVDKTNIVTGAEFSGAMKVHLAYAKNDRDIEKTAAELGMSMHDLREQLGE